MALCETTSIYTLLMWPVALCLICRCHCPAMACWWDADKRDALEGDWDAAEKRAAAGPDEPAGSDDDVFGDFEDMEAGKLSFARHSSHQSAAVVQYKCRADSCPLSDQYLSAGVKVCPSHRCIRVPAASPSVQD